MFCHRPIFTHAWAAPDGWKTGTKVDEVPGAWFSAAQSSIIYQYHSCSGLKLTPRPSVVSIGKDTLAGIKCQYRCPSRAPAAWLAAATARLQESSDNRTKTLTYTNRQRGKETDSKLISAHKLVTRSSLQSVKCRVMSVMQLHENSTSSQEMTSTKHTRQFQEILQKHLIKYKAN